MAREPESPRIEKDALPDEGGADSPVAAARDDSVRPDSGAAPSSSSPGSDSLSSPAESGEGVASPRSPRGPGDIEASSAELPDVSRAVSSAGGSATPHSPRGPGDIEASSAELPDVSRETAERVFGSALPVAEHYAALLAGDGVVRGLIGPREVPRLWERHLLNCAVLAELIPDDADVLDIGSGAGLPGIPLAIVRPDVWVTLVEPMERRTTFLRETVKELGLDNVEVLQARAEGVSPKGKADVVTSRAVAPLGKLTNWCLPLVRRGGEMLAIKGASAPAEIEKFLAEKPGRAKLRPEVVECGAGLLETPTTVIRLQK